MCEARCTSGSASGPSVLGAVVRVFCLCLFGLARAGSGPSHPLTSATAWARMEAAPGPGLLLGSDDARQMPILGSKGR